MPNDQIRIITKAEQAATVLDNPKRLREATRQMVGQADRTNNLFVEVLCDLVERIEKLEAAEREDAIAA